MTTEQTAPPGPTAAAERVEPPRVWARLGGGEIHLVVQAVYTAPAGTATVSLAGAPGDGQVLVCRDAGGREIRRLTL